MHLKRLIVAAVLLPLMYYYVMYLPSEYFLFLLITISLLAMSEFYSMYYVQGILRYAALFSGASILCVAYFRQDLLRDMIIISIMAVMVIRLFYKRDPVSSLSDIAAPVIGLLYVPGLLSFQTLLKKGGPEWIIFLYGTVWASDSLAYYIGKGIGKRRLYKEISPNKTVAGAAGSVIGGIIGALIFKAAVARQLTVANAVSLGIMIGIISIIGDLVESMFKRDAGVKDSGVIIPGHGGILDKIDGSLFAGPVLYWALIVMKIMD
jgi:phosphatidate cytidylyltransferase